MLKMVLEIYGCKVANMKEIPSLFVLSTEFLKIVCKPNNIVK